jgi:SSS family solute:Na+ symporter
MTLGALDWLVVAAYLATVLVMGLVLVPRPATDPGVPWPGMFVGVFILGSLYWSMDQVLVQRAFAARSLDEGRLGAIFCAFLKLATPFLLVLPGLVTRALRPGLGEADHAFPTLLQMLMPAGLRGVTVAGIAAALMGHISATYNSVATLVTRDFYLRFRPEADPTRQVRVGRMAVLAVFVLGAAWAPVIGQFRSLWIYLQAVQAYLMMPMAGVFFLGVLWRRTNAAGVYACVGTGLVVSPLLIADAQRHFLPLLSHPLLQPWLHRALVAFLVCMAALVLASLATAAPAGARLATTTLAGMRTQPKDPLEARGRGRRDYRVWLGLVVAITTALFYLMR